MIALVSGVTLNYIKTNSTSLEMNFIQAINGASSGTSILD